MSVKGAARRGKVKAEGVVERHRESGQLHGGRGSRKGASVERGGTQNGVTKLGPI